MKNAVAAGNTKRSVPAPNKADLDWFFQSAGDVSDAISGEFVNDQKKL